MKKYRLIVILGFLIIAGLITVLIINHRDKSLIPKSIIQKASFSIFFPQSNTPGLDPEPKTITYSSTYYGLSYTVLVNKKEVLISEQATPDVFSQSGVYAYKLSQVHDYDSFNSASGEVDLTRPTGLQNQTVAWVNNKGTLILAHALQSLTISEWQLLFNNMSITN